MKNAGSAKFYATSTSIIVIMMLLLLTDVLLPTSNAVLEKSPVTGAIWTTDPHGERVNGNLYKNPRKVYLAGGPHKKGSAGLPDGFYHFQVTDPAGKKLLSDDDLSDRMFTVEDGYIISSNPGTHDENDDTTRGCGVVVQLWPFTFSRKNGGVYKVWVTREDHYDSSHGCFGFIPSLSKTDNFKVGVAEVSKYFELWVTEGISEPPDMEFYVSYTIDGDGNPLTEDPADPWTTGQQLIHVGTVNGYDVFREGTSFSMGTYVYWVFSARRVENAFTWESVMYGPELIDKEGIVNKEILFMVNGHKYDYRDWLAGMQTGLEGWTIELYRDDTKIAETQTGSDGSYELIGGGSGNFRVCEILKHDEGWANATPTCYKFTVDGNNGGDLTFDFYNYKMIPTHGLTDTSDYRCELSWFDVVFTPSNEGPDRYKLSSTNPGSFYFNVVKYGTAGTDVRIEVSLPLDQANKEYDSPNFILHHTDIGSTPVLDVHVYAGRQGKEASLCSSEWIPKWETDITDIFDITPTEDGKHVTVEGTMPDTGEVFVTVHIDYQISGSLTWDQVQSFYDFEYAFRAEVYYSMIGVTANIGIRR